MFTAQINSNIYNLNIVIFRPITPSSSISLQVEPTLPIVRLSDLSVHRASISSLHSDNCDTEPDNCDTEPDNCDTGIKMDGEDSVATDGVAVDGLAIMGGVAVDGVAMDVVAQEEPIRTAQSDPDISRTLLQMSEDEGTYKSRSATLDSLGWNKSKSNFIFFERLALDSEPSPK